MKRKENNWLFLLMFLVVCAGCMKSTPSGSITNALSPIIQGNFAGQFTLIHQSSKTGKLDTGYAQVVVTLSSTNSFKVTGDTTAIQYPSYGFYLVGSDGTITFTDATVTKTTNLNAPKKHLNGTFLYQYSAPNLVISGSSDTLNYNYTLQNF